MNFWSQYLVKEEKETFTCKDMFFYKQKNIAIIINLQQILLFCVFSTWQSVLLRATAVTATSGQQCGRTA